MMLEWFDYLVIMNIWFYYFEFVYFDGIKDWNKNWYEGGMYYCFKFDFGFLLVLSG